MDIKVVKLMNRIPGGIMVIPLLAGALLNTFLPGTLTIGGFTTGLLKEGTSCLMGLFLICCGASISFKQVGAPLYKGALLTVLKLIIGIAIGWGVQYMFGNEGIFGITPVALIAVLTNSSGSIYATLADRFGDSTDVGAVSVLSINDGPFLTMVALGATGMSDIPFMVLLATILPIIIGIVWGNLDGEFRELCSRALPLIIIFLSFVLGAGMSFVTVIQAGASGIVLGAVVLVFSGLLLNALYCLILRKKTAVGAAAGTAAGNSVATPAAIAEADPGFAPYAAVATAQCSAACVMTAILCPVMVALLDKRIKKKQLNVQNMKEEKKSMKNDRIILKNVNVFDGISDELQENCMVVMEKGLIREIIKSDCENVENAKVIDLKGCTVSPGFIDCHMHMLLEEVTDKETSLATASPGGERLDTAQAAVAYLGAYNCRRMLEAGFTTVIDGGGNNYIECALKEAINKGYFDGPDLYIAGKQITTNKAHFVGFSMEPYGPYGMRKAVRDLMYHSVDHIKLQLSPPIRIYSGGNRSCNR